MVMCVARMVIELVLYCTIYPHHWCCTGTETGVLQCSVLQCSVLRGWLLEHQIGNLGVCNSLARPSNHHTTTFRKIRSNWNIVRLLCILQYDSTFAFSKVPFQAEIKWMIGMHLSNLVIFNQSLSQTPVLVGNLKSKKETRIFCEYLYCL